jgi:glycosyltransferase involved in cell wall biosynthesis
MVTAVDNGISGYVDTNVDKLIPHMQRLLSDHREAHRLGKGARRQALRRFNIQRFVSDWNEAFASVTGLTVNNVIPDSQEVE